MNTIIFGFTLALLSVVPLLIAYRIKESVKGDTNQDVVNNKQMKALKKAWWISMGIHYLVFLLGSFFAGQTVLLLVAVIVYVVPTIALTSNPVDTK